MKIEKIKIIDLVINENNAKEHPEWQVQQIANSIKEFGFNDPIAIDQDNVIIEGHGRVEAIKLLGYEEIDVIRLNHLTENQKSAYIIAHNKIQSNTGFDMEKLIYEMNKLKVEGFDLALTGFGAAEFDSLCKKLEKTSLEADYSESNTEIDLEGGEYTEFECTCPKCGFQFNKG